MQPCSNKIAMAATAALITTLTLSGCSDNSEDNSVPSLQKKICWGAFRSSEVAPLLPNGSEATIESTSNFDLYSGKERASCLLYIDGNTKLLASADRHPSASSIDWSTWEPLNPVPITGGDKGIVWDGGAASSFVCERPDSLPAKDPNWPNSAKYIELQINAQDIPDKKQARKILSSLMQEFSQFAKKELKCQMDT